MAWLIAILLVTIAALSAHAEPFYTIVAPSSFIANSEYAMSFATTGLNKKMNMRVTISCDFCKKVTQTVEVPPDKPIVATIHVSYVDHSLSFDLLDSYYYFADWRFERTRRISKI
jgi:hypothetical protein